MTFSRVVLLIVLSCSPALQELFLILDTVLGLSQNLLNDLKVSGLTGDALCVARMSAHPGDGPILHGQVAAGLPVFKVLAVEQLG